jgi:hypothetical protein
VDVAVTTRRVIEVGIALVVVLFVIGCTVFPVVPAIVAWWVLFDSWRFSGEMDFWRSVFA